MNITRFIIIDDDELNNMVCRITITTTFQHIEVVELNSGEKGLEYISNNYTPDSLTPTILLLDINMPLMTGWEFLYHFERFDSKIKEQINIFMISSSIDSRDKERAQKYNDVRDYISKPLLPAKVKEMVETVCFNR